MCRFHKRPARQDEHEARQKCKPCGHNCAQTAHDQHAEFNDVRMRCALHFQSLPHVAHKSHDHNERPGRCLTQCQASHHLIGREPLVGHSCLRHIRQHSIRTPKSHHCRLAEKPTHLREAATPALPCDQYCKARCPKRQANEQHAQHLCFGIHGVSWCWRIVANQIILPAHLRRCAVRATCKLLGIPFCSEPTNDACDAYDP